MIWIRVPNHIVNGVPAILQTCVQVSLALYEYLLYMSLSNCSSYDINLSCFDPFSLQPLGYTFCNGCTGYYCNEGKREKIVATIYHLFFPYSHSHTRSHLHNIYP